MDGITNSTDMSLSKFPEKVKDRDPGKLQSMGSQRVGHHLATESASTTCNAFAVHAYLENASISRHSISPGLLRSNDKGSGQRSITPVEEEEITRTQRKEEMDLLQRQKGQAYQRSWGQTYRGRSPAPSKAED